MDVSIDSDDVREQLRAMLALELFLQQKIKNVSLLF